jgi:hypothetical protein
VTTREDQPMNSVPLRTRLLALLAGAVLAALGLGALAASAGAQARERTTMVFRHDQASLDSLAALADSLVLGAEDSERGMVTLRGESGDVVRFGDDVLVPKGQRVRGNVVAIGGSIRVEGIIDGDAVSVGGTVRVMPGGDVRGEAVTVAAGRGGKWIGRIPGVVVPPVPPVPEWEEVAGDREERRHDKRSDFWGALVSLVVFALLAWLASLLYTERTRRAMDYLRERPGPSFLLGLGALVGIVPSLVGVAIVAAILCITLIGIPVAVLLLLAYLFGVVLLAIWGYFVAVAVGGSWALTRLRPQDGSPTLLRAMLAGAVLIEGALVVGAFFHMAGAGPFGTLIQVLAWIASALAMFFGIGAVLGSRAGQPPAPVAPFSPVDVPPAPIDPYAPPTGPPPAPPASPPLPPPAPYGNP